MKWRRAGWLRRLLIVAFLLLAVAISGVLPPVSFPPVIANPDYTTLYFVNEQHTVNGLEAYKLNETNSDTKTYVSYTKNDGSFQVWVAVRVFLRHSDGSETELTDGTYNVNVTRTCDGSGIQNVVWNPENASVSSGDALLVRVYLKVAQAVGI